MRGGLRRSFRSVLAAAALLVGIAGCDGSTDPEATLRLVFDQTQAANLVPGGQGLQLTAFDAQGTVVWSSDDPAIATVVSRTGFVEGVSSGTTTIRANDGTSEATLQVTVRNPAFLRLGQATVTFEAVAGEAAPAPVSVSVTNDGDIPIDGLQVDAVEYTSGPAGGWLSATLSSSSAPAQLQLAPNTAALDPGTYTALVTVSDADAVNGPQNVGVTLTVLRPPSIELDRTSVELGTTPGVNAPSVAVGITNGGDRPLTGLRFQVSYAGGQPQGWLAVSLSGSQAPATLTIGALGAGLTEGQYAATVEVLSNLPNVAPRTVSVALTVARDATITLSRTAVAMTAVVGQGNPAAEAVQITNGGGGTLNQLTVDPVSYGGGASGWLTASLSGSVAPATLTLTPNPVGAGLAPGSYTATVTLRSPAADNSPRTVSVTLTVSEQPQIALSPRQGWTPFVAVNGRGDPPSKPLQITNGGGGGDAALTGLGISVEYLTGGAGWLQITPSGGTAPLTVVGQASTSGLAVREHTARVTISSSVAGVTPVSFVVTLDLRWSFEFDVQPLFGQDNCLGCHVSGGNFPRLTPANSAYADLLGGANPLVTPFNPNTGDLVCKIIGGPTCVGSGIDMTMSQSAVLRIREWIAQGAAY